MKVLLMLLVGVACLGCYSSKGILSPDQEKTYEAISKYHQSQAKLNQPVEFYQDDQVQQIILIRHGEPCLDKKSARSRKAMKQYIYDYDTARVHEFDKSPVNIKTGEVDTIYSSSIVRASDTADKLFDDWFVIVEDSIFREFERGVFPLPLIHLRPKTWGVLSRIPWLIGLHSGKVEGFGTAKQRAKKDVVFLEQKTTQNGRVVLVAHGFLNRYLNKYLQEQGWQLSYDGGKGYLSVQVLSRVK